MFNSAGISEAPRPRPLLPETGHVSLQPRREYAYLVAGPSLLSPAIEIANVFIVHIDIHEPRILALSKMRC